MSRAFLAVTACAATTSLLAGCDMFSIHEPKDKPPSQHADASKALPEPDNMMAKVVPDPNAPLTGTDKLIALKQFPQAITALSKEIDAGRDPSPALMTRARLYSKLGKYQLAVDDCDRVLKMDASTIEVLQERGRNYELLGKKQLADDDREEVKYQLAQAALRKNGKPNLAIPYVVPKGESQVTYYHLARSFGGVRPKQALECIVLAEKLNPTSTFAARATRLRDIMLPRKLPSDEALALNLEAFKYISQREKCRELVNKCIAISPDYEYGYITLGAVEKDCHNHEKAAAAFRHALRINPHNVEALSRLGEILVDTDVEEAKKVWRKAVEYDPEDSFDGALLEGYKDNRH